MARPGGDPLRDYYYGGSYASSGVGDVARGSGWGALVVAGVRIPSGPLLHSALKYNWHSYKITVKLNIGAGELYITAAVIYYWEGYICSLCVIYYLYQLFLAASSNEVKRS